MSPVVFPSDIFPVIAHHCHPIDARTLRRLNKEISCVITNVDLAWSEARWRWGQSASDCWRWAVDKGYIGIVRWCLESGGVNVQADGGDALRSAASKGYLRIVRLLLERGANPRAYGGNAVCRAAAAGHLDIVRLFLARGVDGGRRALCQAVAGGHLEVVRLLLENGAHVRAHGGSALYSAAGTGDIEMIHLLLEYGVDVQAHGDRPLREAASRGHLEAVHLLLENGADIDSVGEGGYDALNLAAGSGHPEVVRLLLENGADVHAPNMSPHGGALLCAVRNGQSEVVSEFARAHTDEASRRAAETRYLEVIRLLLEEGADVHACEDDIDLTRCRGWQELVSLLLEYGAHMPPQH